MGFFKRLFGGGGEQQSDNNALQLFIKCGRCGAPVHVRIDLRNDPSENDEDNGYFVAKEVMDDRCFRLMRAEITFDANRREIGREINGGQFISAAEYEELRAARAKPAA